MIDPLALVAEARRIEGDAAMARRILPLLDLTSLRGDETEEEIRELCRDAVDNRVAAACVPPRFVPLARQLLEGSAVRLATVANFPEGSDDLAAVVGEVAEEVDAGAQEVDVVAPLEAVRAGDVELAGELVLRCREVVGDGITLKLILETGYLAEPSLITAVARAAVMAGVDFLKTSTGRRRPGATPEAAALLLTVIREAEGRVGLKLSGGLRTLADAAPYLWLVERVMGESWIAPDHLRFGASRLLEDLRTRLS